MSIRFRFGMSDFQQEDNWVGNSQWSPDSRTGAMHRLGIFSAVLDGEVASTRERGEKQRPTWDSLPRASAQLTLGSLPLALLLLDSRIPQIWSLRCHRRQTSWLGFCGRGSALTTLSRGSQGGRLLYLCFASLFLSELVCIRNPLSMFPVSLSFPPIAILCSGTAVHCFDF